MSWRYLWFVYFYLLVCILFLMCWYLVWGWVSIFKYGFKVYNISKYWYRYGREYNTNEINPRCTCPTARIINIGRTKNPRSKKIPHKCPILRRTSTISGKKRLKHNIPISFQTHPTITLSNLLKDWRCSLPAHNNQLKTLFR